MKKILILCLLIKVNMALAQQKNTLTIAYDYTSFNKNYNESLSENAWQIWSLGYSYRRPKTTYIFKMQQASRFGNQGKQYEIDAYPVLGKHFQGYFNVGFSPDSPVFSKYRLGASIYSYSIKTYELELGIRYLQFQEGTLIYTASLGKYIGDYYFNLRAYAVPQADRSFNQSLRLTGTYYFSNPQNLLSLHIGTGNSTDDYRFIQPPYHTPFVSFGGLIQKEINQNHKIRLDFSQQLQYPNRGIQRNMGFSYAYSF